MQRKNLKVCVDFVMAFTWQVRVVVVGDGSSLLGRGCDGHPLFHFLAVMGRTRFCGTGVPPVRSMWSHQSAASSFLAAFRTAIALIVRQVVATELACGVAGLGEFAPDAFSDSFAHQH